MKYFQWLIGACCLLLASCEKAWMKEPQLEISLPQTTVHVGDSLQFFFQGNPYFVSFYSGELLSDYAFKDGRILPGGKVTMSFNSNTQYGTQANQLSVHASSDFSGDLNIDAVQAATWTDITNRFTLATGTTYVPSGAREVSDLIEDGKPFFIAFKYTMRQPTSTYGLGKTWRIQNFNVKSETLVGEVELSTMANAGWTFVYKGPKEAARNSISSTTVQMRANAVDVVSETEDWCISKPMSAGSVNLGPDRPVVLKNTADNPLDVFKYAYSKPGIYTAVFEYSNESVYQKGKRKKEFIIEVLP